MEAVCSLAHDPILSCIVVEVVVREPWPSDSKISELSPHCSQIVSLVCMDSQLELYSDRRHYLLIDSSTTPVRMVGQAYSAHICDSSSLRFDRVSGDGRLPTSCTETKVIV